MKKYFSLLLTIAFVCCLISTSLFAYSFAEHTKDTLTNGGENSSLQNTLGNKNLMKNKKTQ